MKNYARLTVLDIVKILRDTSGRNDKIDILKDALVNNDEFLRTVKYTYDPYKNYYISSIQAIQDVVPFLVSKTGYRKMAKGFTILDALDQKGSASNKDKLKLAYALEEMNDFDIEVFDLILHRSLDCGVSASSINKALPNTIPTFKVLLCEKFSEKSLKNISYPAIAQVKMDGMRVLAFIESGRVILRSRRGKVIETHGTFDKELFDALGTDSSVVFDGELLVVKKDSTEYESRRTGNGICNKAVRGSITPEDANRLVFVVWDMISVNSFWAADSKVPYNIRLTTLSGLFKNSEKLKIVKGISVDNFQEAQRYYEMQLQDGQEGIILKNAQAHYAGKRTKDCIKMKVENTADLKIIEVLEGVGKYQGQLGSFRCTTEDGLLTVNVGSGFTDSERVEYFTNNMVGQTIEAKYNEIIEDKFGEKSLFLPIFVCVRPDKDIANLLEELK